MIHNHGAPRVVKPNAYEPHHNFRDNSVRGGSIFLHNFAASGARPSSPRRARVADSIRPPASPPNTRADSFGPHHGLHFVGEDDEEELLCDSPAPNNDAAGQRGQLLVA